MGRVKIVSASAGSGKTYSLAQEYIRGILTERWRYRQTLAVTFTNKATAEMKERILGELNRIANDKAGASAVQLARDLGLSEAEVVARAREARSHILHDYGRFAVLTIDKFFQRIVRSFLRELGIDLNYNVELQEDSILESATARMLADVVDDEGLREWIVEFIGERIEANGGWNIRSGLVADGHTVLKEEYRALKQTADKEALRRIVGQLFEEAAQAGEELSEAGRDILAIVDAGALTGDDLNSNLLGWASATARGEVKEPGRTVEKALAGEQMWFKKSSSRQSSAVEEALAQALRTAVECYHSSIRRINTARILRSGYRRFGLMSDLRGRITQISREENLLHISETNEILTHLISDSDTPFVFEKVGSYYTHYMLDEFQDTSSMQWQNFLPLLRNAVAQSDDDVVMLVGDAKQAIYRWRGGDAKILSAAGEQFEDTVYSTLTQNWRSRREIVEFNNALFERLVAAGNGELNERLDVAARQGDIEPAMRDELHDRLKVVYADCRQQPVRSAGGYVTVRRYGKDGEGRSVPPVVAMVEQLQGRGFRARDIAILVRTRNEGERVANMLLERKREVVEMGSAAHEYNYDVITQEALLVGHAGVCRFVVAVLALTAGTQDDGIPRAIYNRYLGRDFGSLLPDGEREFMALLSIKSLEEAFNEIVMHYCLNDDPNNIAYLQAIEEQIIRFMERGRVGIADFTEWFERSGANESLAMPTDADAITIDTIHKSKGLGYEAVIIPWCNWALNSRWDTTVWSVPSPDIIKNLGMFPVKFTNESSHSAFAAGYYREAVNSYIDALNILYVATTRAKSELHIMFPEKGGGVSELISAALQPMDELMEWGEPESVEPVGITRNISTFYLTFGVNPVSERVAISFASQRYFEERASDARLTPRNYGILMHSLFASATTSDQLYEALDLLRAQEKVNDAECEQLRAHIDLALENPTVAGWFVPTWEQVLNEADIIVPASGSCRPDRVMIAGRRAVVVDYKFGDHIDNRHNVQVRKYMELLSQMGCRPEGYLWYVNLDITVEV